MERNVSPSCGISSEIGYFHLVNLLILHGQAAPRMGIEPLALGKGVIQFLVGCKRLILEEVGRGERI